MTKSQRISKSKSIFWQQSIADQWRLYTPPVRPSVKEIAIWRSFIKKKKAKTMILGATPELRDLAHSLGHELVLVDISILMMIGMKAFMKYKDKSEIWLKADWLAVPLRENQFDYIIGDFVINNLPYKLQPLLFKKMARLLKNQGLLILRHNGPVKNQEISRVFEKFVEDDKDLSLRKINELFNILNKMSQDPKDCSEKTSITRKQIQRYLKSLPKTRAKSLSCYLDLYNVLYKGEKVWWRAPLEELHLWIKKYFKILAIKQSDEYAESANCPIYVLRKK